MRGLDTNILLRLFDRSDESQTAAVERMLKTPSEGEAFLLNPIVLSEFAWTLQRAYKQSRSVVADHIERILESPEFAMPFLDEALHATRRYREGKAQFADYFIAAINQTLGCSATVTFDKDACDDEKFVLLKV